MSRLLPLPGASPARRPAQHGDRRPLGPQNSSRLAARTDRLDSCPEPRYKDIAAAVAPPPTPASAPPPVSAVSNPGAGGESPGLCPTAPHPRSGLRGRKNWGTCTFSSCRANVVPLLAGLPSVLPNGRSQSPPHMRWYGPKPPPPPPPHEGAALRGLQVVDSARGLARALCSCTSVPASSLSPRWGGSLRVTRPAPEGKVPLEGRPWRC